MFISLLTAKKESAGFAVIESFALRLICVEPGYQRRGIGSALLEEAESYVSRKGFDKLLTGGVSSEFLIGADKAAKGFFEKKGFRKALIKSRLTAWHAICLQI